MPRAGSLRNPAALAYPVARVQHHPVARSEPRDGLGRAVVAVSNLDRDALSSVSVVGNALRLRMVRALGRPARENWSELWDDLEPLLAASAKPERPSRPRIVRSISSEEDMERPSISMFLSAVLEADGTVGGVLCSWSGP